MWGLIERPADLRLFRNFIHAGEQMHVAPIRIRQHPFQLLCRCATPIHMQLRGNLIMVRMASIRRISQHYGPTGRMVKLDQPYGPTGRRRAQGVKLDQSVLCVRRMKSSARQVRTLIREDLFEI